MRYFSLIVLLLVLSVAACFGQEVKPEGKSKPKLRTTPAKPRAAKAKSAPKTQPTAEQSKAADVKPQEKTKAETTPAKSDPAPTKPQDKPKSQTAESKSNQPQDESKPKAESKDKPATQTKAVKSKTSKSKTAKQTGTTKTATRAKSKRTKAETKDKSKQTAVEPKEKQKTLTPNPPTQTAPVKPALEKVPVKSKPETVSVKPKTDETQVKPKPDVVAVKPKTAPKTGFQPCALQDAPAIRNLRLGMSRKDADQIIPTAGRVNYINSSTITAYPDAARGFENIGQVTAQFDEDRLNVLEIDYDRSAVQWKSVEEFAVNLSDNLKLPRNAWDFRFKKWNRAEMKCKGFSLKINSEMNELTLENSGSSGASEQEASGGKKAFKP
ncbi:MAG TPA: hypothetical protein VF599_19395 [Pyrinomonadaceae bacterium]|jgi:hypothetical protein